MVSKRKRDELEPDSDFEDYEFMNEDSKPEVAATVPTEDTNHPSDAILREHRGVIPTKLQPIAKNDKKRIRIHFRETDLDTANEFLQKFERWYTKHQLAKASGSDAPDVAEWKKRLLADPLGDTPAPKTDVRCWFTRRTFF